jgi:arylsulfatase A-like enzyme
MDRRQFLTQSLGTAALAAQNRPEAATRPNILHIMSDQQQWATIANRSLCRTPYLNRLAASGMLFERSYTPSAVCCPARAMLLSGAYHWHNGVYNQIHSSPSVHRDMNADVVLYSHRLKEAGYRMGYVGKWHASWVRCPADFGYEMSAVQGCDPAILRKYDLNPDRIDNPRERLKATPLRMIQWPGANPVAEWGYHEGPVEATPEWHVA